MLTLSFSHFDPTATSRLSPSRHGTLANWAAGTEVWRQLLVNWGWHMTLPRSEPKYDRDFLLSPDKRNELVELWEVEKYGRDAVKDPLGDAIGRDVAKVVASASGKYNVGVVDPFAGSCNGLYAIVRHLPGSKGIGFEIQQSVFDLTSRNVAHLNVPVDLVFGSYKNCLASHRHPADHLIVAFLAPPWADALHPLAGLHLDRTKPPILEIVRDFEQVYGSQPVLYVTEVHEVNEPTALKAVVSTFDWSDLRIYDVNAPGLQHGILLGTRRWPL